MRLRFTFAIEMAVRDVRLIHALQTFLGQGSVRHASPRQTGYQPTVSLSVNSHRTHHAVTIPFFEAHLPPSAKRQQFERWRDDLIEYERVHPNRWGNGPSPCSEPGCGKPVRGRGLCRSHYHRATGY